MGTRPIVFSLVSTTTTTTISPRPPKTATLTVYANSTTNLLHPTTTTSPIFANFTDFQKNPVFDSYLVVQGCLFFILASSVIVCIIYVVYVSLRVDNTERGYHVGQTGEYHHYDAQE